MPVTRSIDAFTLTESALRVWNGPTIGEPVSVRHGGPTARINLDRAGPYRTAITSAIKSWATGGAPGPVGDFRGVGVVWGQTVEVDYDGAGTATALGAGVVYSGGNDEGTGEAAAIVCGVASTGSGNSYIMHGHIHTKADPLNRASERLIFLTNFRDVPISPNGFSRGIDLVAGGAHMSGTALSISDWSSLADMGGCGWQYAIETSDRSGASGLGTGGSRPDARLVVRGLGQYQTWTPRTDRGLMGTLKIQSADAAPLSGGMLTFGARGGSLPSSPPALDFAAIKGLLYDGSGLGYGDLGFFHRMNPSDEALTMRATLNRNGWKVHGVLEMQRQPVEPAGWSGDGGWLYCDKDGGLRWRKPNGQTVQVVYP